MADGIPSSLEQNPENNSYVPGPVGTGNMLIDMLLGMISGGQLAPRPSQSQTILDASILRERSRDFMRIHQQMLFQNQLTQSLRINAGPGLGMMGMMGDAMTGGRISSIMGYLGGGNMVQAGQGLYANMTGLTMAAMGPGNLRNIAAADVGRMMGDYTRWIQGPTGNSFIDYSRSFGMQTQDITSAFSQAARMGMLGRNAGVQSAFQGFLGGNFGGAGAVGGSGNMGWLHALGTTFGTSGPKESMDLLNRLMGPGGINLTDSSQTQNLEQMVWKVKGMSRAAGVSIQAMASIIQESQQLMRDHPALRYMNGLTGLGISTRAMGSTAATVATMDPNLVRMLGGPEAIARQAATGEVQAFANPVSTRIASLYFGLGANKNPEIAAALKNYMASGNTTTTGFSQFLGTLGKATGMSPSALFQMATSKEFAARGMNMITNEGGEFQDLIQRTGRRSDIRAVESMLSRGGIDLGSFRKAMEENGGDWTQALATVSAAEKDPGRRAAAQRTAAIFADRYLPAVMETGLTSAYMREVSPAFRDKERSAANAAKRYADEVADTERKYGHLRGPLLQNVFTSLMRGDLVSKGLAGTIKYLFNPMGTSGESSIANAIIDIQKNGATAGNIGGLGISGLDASSVGVLTALSKNEKYAGKSIADIMAIKENDEGYADVAGAQKVLSGMGYGKDRLLTNLLQGSKLDMKSLGSVASTYAVADQQRKNIRSEASYQSLSSQADTELVKRMDTDDALWQKIKSAGFDPNQIYSMAYSGKGGAAELIKAMGSGGALEGVTFGDKMSKLVEMGEPYEKAAADVADQAQKSAVMAKIAENLETLSSVGVGNLISSLKNLVEELSAARQG